MFHYLNNVSSKIKDTKISFTMESRKSWLLVTWNRVLI